MALTEAAAGLIGGGISSVGNLVGGLINSHSQDKINRMNLQIAREQNAANQQLQNNQNEWNLAQWNRENAYNSAASQVARYRAAGLNPALMMNQNGSAGTASSLQSADYTPSQGAVMQSPQWGNGINSAIDSFFGNQLMMANVVKARADAQNALAGAKVANYNADVLLPKQANKTDSDILNVQSDTRLKDSMKAKQDMENNVYRLFGSKMQQAQLDTLNAGLNKITSDIAVNVSKIALNNSSVKVNDSQVKLNVSQIKLNAAKAFESYCNANHLNVDAAQIQALLPYMVDKIKSDTKLNNANAGLAGANTALANANTEGVYLNNDYLPYKFTNDINESFGRQSLQQKDINTISFGTLGKFSGNRNSGDSWGVFNSPTPLHPNTSYRFKPHKHKR